MLVDIKPLGSPELGMTRAELVDASYAALESFNAETELFYVLLFAYMVAMYIAGSQLTRVQYAIANTMYLLVMANTVLATFFYHLDSSYWNKAAGYPQDDWPLYWTAALRVILIGLSIWFGRKVRHPSLK